jgi:2-keto-3-deoxy-L-rhamnonate aldolase RhmA
MRLRSAFGMLALLLSATPLGAQTTGRATERLNPLVALHEQGQPVFGITHPAIEAGRGRGPGGGGAAAAEPAAAPSLAEAARQTVTYTDGDYAYNSFGGGASGERFLGYVAALIQAGGSVREHPFLSKVPIWHEDPAAASARTVEQLNAGHAGIIMQHVESAEEVRQGIAAMRFRARGGARPDDGVGLAAAFWGLTKEEYLNKADLWPLNPRGELVLWVIVESHKGIANVREIAAEPGVAVVTVGAGTLGGVFSSTNAAGERVRDQAAFDQAVATILAACKEYRKPCGYPANNPADVERLMKMGFSVFVMQRRDQNAFDAVATGRRLAGRPVVQQY